MYSNNSIFLPIVYITPPHTLLYIIISLKLLLQTLHDVLHFNYTSYSYTFIYIQSSPIHTFKRVSFYLREGADQHNPMQLSRDQQYHIEI